LIKIKLRIGVTSIALIYVTNGAMILRKTSKMYVLFLNILIFFSSHLPQIFVLAQYLIRIALIGNYRSEDMLANTVFTRLQLRSNEGIVVDHSRK